MNDKFPTSLKPHAAWIITGYKRDWRWLWLRKRPCVIYLENFDNYDGPVLALKWDKSGRFTIDE